MSIMLRRLCHEAILRLLDRQLMCGYFDPNKGSYGFF